MKAMLVGISLLIICTANSFALGFRDLDQRRELWDMQHITLSCIGTAYFNHVCKMPYWKAALTSIMIGMVWEGFDELYQNGKLGNRCDHIFDKRYGFDIGDIVRNSIGIAIAFPIRKK